MEAHPIRLLVDDDLSRNRLTVLFRLLLAIPLLVWLVLWTVAVAIAAIVGWVATLVTGSLPESLHKFFGSYVRYVTHVGGYLALAAGPYPGFTGEPGYPVDVTIPASPLPQKRWTVALRLVLALPALLLAAVLGSGFGGGGRAGDSWAEWTAAGIGGVAAVCAVLGWFAILATGRMPLGLRNLAAYGIGYTAQAHSYLLLLTDRYPDSNPEAIGPAWELPPQPGRLALADDRRRSRMTVLFRPLLTIPHFVWLALWSVAAFLAGLVNGLVALVTGRSGESLHRFLASYVRYYAHVTAFLTVVANPFPGFTGAPGYPVDIEVGPPQLQNRWVTLFRIFLAIPALLVSGALTGALVVVGVLGWFSALVTGRMPTGIRNLGAVAVRYQAQTNAYLFVLTEAYPHASPALRPLPEPEPEPA